MTKGGHNVGILSEPGHPDRAYRILEHKRDDAYIGPENWLEVAELRDGSWWCAWHDWLVENSLNVRISAPELDPSLPAAPGDYVLQK